MRTTTRRADASDLVDMIEIDASAGGDVERSDSIRRAVERGRCLVAEHSGHVIGYVVSEPEHLFGRDFIELLIVRDSHRRQGVGRALLRAALEIAGTPRVFSSTNDSNVAMRSLFTTDGWALSGVLDGLDPGDPEVVFFIDRATQRK